MECSGIPGNFAQIEKRETEMETKKDFLSKVTEFDKDGVKGFVAFHLGNDSQIIVDMSTVSPENMYHAAVHGISQRLGDACSAFSKDKEYGKAFEKMKRIMEVLKTPDWNVEREGGEGKRQDYQDLVAALAKLKKTDAEVVQMAVDNASPEKLKAWASNPDVKAEIADIRAKRAKANAKAAKVTLDDITFD